MTPECCGITTAAGQPVSPHVILSSDDTDDDTSFLINEIQSKKKKVTVLKNMSKFEQLLKYPLWIYHGLFTFCFHNMEPK